MPRLNQDYKQSFLVNFLLTSSRLTNVVAPITAIITALIVATITIASLSSCSKQNDYAVQFDNYLYRLGNATLQDVSIDKFHQDLIYPDEAHALPSKRLRTLPISDIRLNISDLFRLNNCQLLPNIIKRNTSLGKVMKPSQQLIYEREILFALSDCQQTLATDKKSSDDTKAIINGILDIKKNEISHHYWNGLFSSIEFEKLFSVRKSPLSKQELHNLININQALEYYQAIGQELQNPAFIINTQELEQHFQQLQIENLMGRLLTTLTITSQYLNRG